METGGWIMKAGNWVIWGDMQFQILLEYDDEHCLIQVAMDYRLPVQGVPTALYMTTMALSYTLFR